MQQTRPGSEPSLSGAGRRSAPVISPMTKAARTPQTPAAGRLRSVSVASVALLTGVASTAALLVVARDAWRAIARPGPASAADGILLAAGAAGAALALWFGVSLLLAALAALPGRAGAICHTWADRIAPAFVRRAVALVLGSTLTAGALPGMVASAATAGAPLRAPLSAPAAAAASVAASGQSPDPAPQPTGAPVPRPEFQATGSTAASTELGEGITEGPAPSEPDPAWLPARPATPVRTAVAPSLGVLRPAATGHRVEEQVVVRRGDTLWDIAARHLGAESSAAEIAQEWPRWYAANRSLIGDNPDLILPGQRLVPPDIQKASR